MSDGKKRSGTKSVKKNSRKTTSKKGSKKITNKKDIRKPGGRRADGKEGNKEAVSFSSPEVASAFKLAVKKYSAALKRLKD